MYRVESLRRYFKLFVQSITGSEHQDYTTGNIKKAIVLLSIPMILEMSMEGIFAVVDMFYIGLLHDNDAIATVGLTESILSVVYAMAMGLSMGATAMISRRVGEKNIQAAENAARQALYLGVTLSIVISLVGIFYAETLLGFMGGSPTLIERNVGYTKWMIIGNLPIILLFLINGILRGAGDAAMAFKSLMLANLLNIIFCPVFIFGIGAIPAFGIEGAAIATTLGRSLAVAYQFRSLFGGKSVLQLRWQQWVVDVTIIGRLIRVSIGAMGQFLVGSASWIVLMRIMSEFGSDVQAGYVIAIRIVMFALLPAWGMANAAATLVGQNLGAGKPDRAEISATLAARFNMVFMGVLAVITFVFAEQILLFFSTEVHAVHSGVECLRMVCFGYLFYAYGMVLNQSFNGAGDTRTPIIISFFGFWIFQIPLAYYLAMETPMAEKGVYIAISLAESCMAITAYLVFQRGKWKSVKI
jgi:putative MATE family efflux protein